MYFLIIISIIVCVLLGLIVLIQNPKGGGLSSNFSSSSQLLGVQKTGDILEKGTWTLAILLMVLALTINVIGKSGASTTKSADPDSKAQADKIKAAPDTKQAAPFGGLQPQPVAPKKP